jgi:hypothetical protein
MSNEMPFCELFIEELGQVYGGGDEPSNPTANSEDNLPPVTRCVCETPGTSTFQPGGAQPTPTAGGSDDQRPMVTRAAFEAPGYGSNLR